MTVKRSILLIITILLVCPALFGQTNTNANLLLQSADGKTVKLLWFFNHWDPNISAFDIKRKEGLQDWMKLNVEPIVPEISTQKKLSIVENDPVAESMVRSKFYKMISTKKVRLTDHAAFLQQLSKDDKALQELTNMMMRDYDLALIAGFAYVDHTVLKKDGYKYGLFIHGSDKIVDSATWNYGEIPDLNTVTNITSRPVNKSGIGIHIIWNADLNKMKMADVAGFNIYREGIRLNSTPITASNSKDPSEFIWYDRSANSTLPIQYSISAESIFGIEGIIKSYTYNPADHPDEYKKAKVTNVASLGYYFKEGIDLQWTFPKEYERFLTGFNIEKDNMPNGYQHVSSVLDASSRSYIDKSPSPTSAYIRFRVNAVYSDKTITTGTERLYYYFPVREPPQPQNLTAQSVSGDKKITVYLTWEPPMNGDTVTDYYRVYVSEPGSNKFVLVTENQPVTASKYTYIIQHGSPGVYKFAVTAFSKGKTESLMSNTVGIQSSSLELATPSISKVSIEKNIALVQWQYPEIADLKGFRLYQNNILIADETVLKKTTAQFITSRLDEGNIYSFTIRAIAENSVLSDYSQPATITIPISPKR
jgi:hypothetical protein